MEAISLYTGAGGLDLGVEAAGFEIAVAVKMDADSVRTLEANRDWTVIPRDIHKVSSRESLSQIRSFSRASAAAEDSGYSATTRP